MSELAAQFSKIHGARILRSAASNLDFERAGVARNQTPQEPKIMKIRAVVLLSTLLGATGCGNERESASRGPTNAAAGGAVEKLSQQAKDAAMTTRDYLLKQKENLQRNLSDKMAGFNRQISDLKTRSTQAGRRARSGWTDTLARLQQKKEAAAHKLEQLKNSTTDKWQEFKTDAEAAFADLEKAVRDAFTRFREDD